MKIETAVSSAHDTPTALEEVAAQLVSDRPPQFMIISTTVDHDGRLLVDGLNARFPDCIIQGGTSCRGVMTAQGFLGEGGLGAFAIYDGSGAYGVGAEELGADPRAAAARATASALEQAGRPGELPVLVWLIAAPGSEESLLAGIADAVGPQVPVSGGSSADNDVSGQWLQFAGDQIYNNAVTVAVLFPSTAVSWAFHSGYTPTEQSGRVTRASGRTVLEINAEPAADVYDAWIGGRLKQVRKDGGNILAQSSLHPLGREVASLSKVPHYRLSHPEAITGEGGLSLFSDIEVGDELTLMTGDLGSLVSRAGRVALAAAKSGSLDVDQISGALVIYCAGCMLTVADEMPSVAEGLKQALDGVPFLGAFTFGEQGCFRAGENHHGNLMISVVLFGK